MLFENRLLKKRIGKMINSIDSNVVKSDKFSLKNRYAEAFYSRNSRGSIDRNDKSTRREKN